MRVRETMVMRRTQPTDRIQERMFRRLNYCDPARVLEEFRRQARKWESKGVPRAEFPLRLRRDKRRWERWQAAVFAYGLQIAVLRRPVWFAQQERSDHDAVFRIGTGESADFVPVQLKEVVPATLNDQCGAQQVLDGLARYGTSDGTAVCVFLNRVHGAEATWALPPGLRLGSLWLLGMHAADPPGFTLLGDCMTRPRAHGFAIEQPQAAPAAPVRAPLTPRSLGWGDGREAGPPDLREAL